MKANLKDGRLLNKIKANIYKMEANTQDGG